MSAVILINTIQRAAGYLRTLPVLCAVLHTAYTYPVKIIHSCMHRVIISSHDSEAEISRVGVYNNQRSLKPSRVLKGLIS